MNVVHIVMDRGEVHAVCDSESQAHEMAKALRRRRPRPSDVRVVVRSGVHPWWRRRVWA